MISDIYIEKLEEVSKIYGMRIYRVCMDILGNDMDAEDAAQDTYIKILRYLDRIGDLKADSAGRYISLAAESAAKNMLKRDKRKRSSDLLWLSDETVGAVIETETARRCLEESQASSCCIDILDEYMDVFNDADLIMLKYHTEEIRTLKETAEHFGMTPEAFRKRVQRLRRRIAESRGVRGTDADK